MISRIAFALLFALFLTPTVGLAQGSGSTSPKSSERAHSVRKALTGTVTKVDTEEQVIVLEDKNGRQHEFKIGPKARFKADKNTELAGTRFDLGDIQAGSTVRITYIASNRVVTEVRLRNMAN